MDELEQLATLGGSAAIIGKILGPTAEYLGGGLKDFTEKRVQNVHRIFSKAEHKLGDRIDEPGIVGPRVLKIILDDGSFCDDEVVADYLGGVLASSRSDISNDDRGVFWLSIITGLSSYQLRAHYVFYTLLRRLLAGEPGVETWRGDHLDQTSIFIPADDLTAAGLATSGAEGGNDITIHAVMGLLRSDLVGDKYGIGGPGALTNLIPLAAGFDLTGALINATPIGIQLYQWAAGLAPDPAVFCQQEPFVLDGIVIPANAKTVRVLNAELAALATPSSSSMPQSSSPQ